MTYIRGSSGFGGGGGGTITAVNAGTGLTGGGTSGSISLSIASSGVSAGSYTLAGLTVDATGRITSASNGSAYVPGGTDVAVADGGTGASTAAGARTNLGAAASGNWTSAGITGGVTAIPSFDGSGQPILVAAPSADQKANKVLGWNSDGTIGWVAAVVTSVALVSGVDLIQDGYSREYITFAVGDASNFGTMSPGITVKFDTGTIS